jgi:hypothetical protein
MDVDVYHLPQKQKINQRSYSSVHTIKIIHEGEESKEADDTMAARPALD